MHILHDLNIDPLIKAHTALQEALKRANMTIEDDMLRDACIQRFEFTFELAWKTLKRILAYRGIELNSPRQVFRFAAKEQLIADPELWFDFLEKRNKTTYTYNHEIAKEIFQQLASFESETNKMIATIKKL